MRAIADAVGEMTDLIPIPMPQHPPAPLALTDAQLTELITVAGAMPVRQRGEFRRAMSEALR